MTLERYLTLQDKVRLHLNELISGTGKSYVNITVDELASSLRSRNYDVYQALYRLRKLGEIEVEKEDGAKKIVGIKVHKLEPSGRTYQRASEKAKVDIKQDVPSEVEDFVSELTAYLKQKLAVADMRKTATESGLNPDLVITFTPNPVAEEGVHLLNLLKDAYEENKKLKQENQMYGYDLEAAKRDIANLKHQKQEDFRKELVGA